MIVCSCNCINHRQIHNAVDDIMLVDPLQVLTPAMVYKTIGSRPKCGSCLSHAAELIQKRAACLRGCHDCSCEVQTGFDNGDLASDQRSNHSRQVAL